MLIVIILDSYESLMNEFLYFYNFFLIVSEGIGAAGKAGRKPV